MAYLQLKHLGVHLDGLDMRHTYTNSIRNDFFKAQNESYQMTYAVKTLENLFTWCGDERYLMMMEMNRPTSATLFPASCFCFHVYQPSLFPAL